MAVLNTDTETGLCLVSSLFCTCPNTKKIYIGKKKPNKTLKCLTYRACDNLKSQTLNFPLIYFTQQAVHTSLINKRCDIISNVFTVLSVIPCHKQKNIISWFDTILTELPGYTPHHSQFQPDSFPLPVPAFLLQSPSSCILL